MNGGVLSRRRVACLFFPLWPVQRLVVSEPQLRRRCLVLFRRDSRRGQVVHAASPLAQRRGICRGMPLSEARSLAKKGVGNPFPVVVREADPQADREALRELALELHRFSPLVGLEESDDPHSLLLDISGLVHLFGGESGWSAAVREWLVAEGWHLRMALADTMGAAWALANHAVEEWSSLRGPFLPGGAEPPAVAASALDLLPVEALRIGSELCDTLAEVGVRTIGQLRRLPRAGLAARLGDGPARRLDQLDGRLPEPVCAVTPSDSFTATLPLEHPLTDRRTLVVAVQQLVSRTAAALAARQQGALRWRVGLARYQAEAVTLEIGLFAPLAEAGHLRQLVEMHLEQLRDFHTLQNPVTGIAVTALECVRMVDHQRELFAAQDDRTDPAALAMLVNRLAARLGAARVLRPQVLAEAQPERAVRHHPLTGSRASARAPRQVPALPGPLERPLRLLCEPLPVRVETGGSGSPRTVWTAEGPLPVAESVGPERIETGWWRGPPVRRDYWRIETSTARRLWIHQDLQSGEWFLQGVF